jgi:hypothetical protein
MKYRTLIYSTAFSIALIALASVPAMSAQPGKPPAKSPIYGTPAQLVADFASAGYDLQKMVYNRQGQMPSPWMRIVNSSGYEHGNTVLARIPHSGKLFFICITSPVFSKFVGGEPTGEFKYIFRMSPDDAIKRYGSEYMHHTVLTDESGKWVHDIVTYMLLNEPSDDVWEIRFTWDNHDRLASIYGGLHFGSIGRVDVDRPDSSQPVGRLYADLETLGLGYLKPVGNPEITSANNKNGIESGNVKSCQIELHNGCIEFRDDVKEVSAFSLLLFVPGGEYDLRTTKYEGEHTRPTYPLDGLYDLLDDITSWDSRYGVVGHLKRPSRFFVFLVEQGNEHYLANVSYRLLESAKSEKDALYIDGYISGPLYPIR